MLDNEFCEILEYKLSNALNSSGNPDTKGFWCDGILLPDDEGLYSQMYVNDNRKIVLTAFLGKTGQERYELILNFGSKSLSRYQRELDLSEYITDKVVIDTDSKTIQVFLQ